MKKFTIVFILVFTLFMSGCTSSANKLDTNIAANNQNESSVKVENIENVTSEQNIDWSSETKGVKCAEDFLLLSTKMKKEEIDKTLGIVGVVDEAAKANGITQYNYEYPDGNIIEAVFFKNYHILSINVHSEIQFADANIDNCDLSSLNLESTYEDYVNAIGSKGILIGLNGDMTKTYLWVNSKGNKLEAEFDAFTGKILRAYNYF